MNNITTVNKIDNKVFEYIVKIGDENFANGYFTKEYLMTYLNDSNSFVLVYEKHEKIIGFSISTMWNSDDLFSHTAGFHLTLI